MKYTSRQILIKLYAWTGELVETAKKNFPTDVRSRALSKAIPLVKYISKTYFERLCFV